MKSNSPSSSLPICQPFAEGVEAGRLGLQLAEAGRQRIDLGLRIALDLGQFRILALDLGLQPGIIQRAGANAASKADNAAYPEHAAQQGTGRSSK